MNTKPRERILMLAILLGVAAAAMIWTVLRSSGEPPANAQTQVVTAASNIPSGMVLTAAKLQIRSFPSNLVPPGAAVSKEAVVGKVAQTDIKAGQPISLTSLSAKDRLSYVVPPFMRAVTVGIDPVIGVGGFLKPGDHVDVVATFEIDGSSYAKTVLQNVSLLAIGAQSEEGSNLSADKATARAQPTATLAVTPNDAEKLILADAKGKLRLALRSSEDRSITPRKPVSAQAVMGVASKASQAAGGSSSAPANTSMPRLGPAPIFPPESVSLPRMTQAAESTGKTIVIVRGTETEEAVVSE